MKFNGFLHIMFSKKGYMIHCGGFLSISGTSPFRIHIQVPMTKQTSSPGDHFFHSTTFVPGSSYTSLGLKPDGGLTEYAKEFKSDKDLVFTTDIINLHGETFQGVIKRS